MRQLRRRWAFYWRALDNQDFDGWDDPDAPFPGYWRLRYSRRSLFLPVAIWDAPRKRVVCTIAGKPGNALEAWVDHRCWMHPVTEAAYRHAIATGQWSDGLVGGKHSKKAGKPVTNLRDAAAIVPKR